jgi:hypothetical protein
MGMNSRLYNKIKSQKKPGREGTLANGLKTF